jgi:hypothetical protein
VSWSEIVVAVIGNVFISNAPGRFVSGSSRTWRGGVWHERLALVWLASGSLATNRRDN